MRHFRELPYAALVPLSSIEGGWLATLDDDWAVLVRLHQLGFDGLITADDGMIELPKELAVLMQTRMLLVVLAHTNRDVLETTGLLLLHIRRILGQRNPSHAQLFLLHPPPVPRPEEDITDRFRQRARHQHRDDHRQFLAELQIPVADMARSLRDWYSPP